MKTDVAHSHAMDECDIRKYPSAVRQVVQNEVSRGLSPDVIKNVLNQSKEEQIVNLPCVEYLRKDSQFIYNQVYPTLVGKRTEFTSQGFDQDLLEALSELDDEAKYYYRVVQEGTAIVGLVWVLKQFKDLIVKHGILFQMDSTHNINIHGWNLFNFVYRDKYGI